MFQTKFVEKTKTHILCSVIFFPFQNGAVYEINVQKYCRSGQDYDKGYQQMPLSFVIFLYLYVSTLHVSGLYQPIIRGSPSRCLFVTTWFM